MSEREMLDRKAAVFFEDLWRQGDPWELESTDFERAKYARQLAMVGGRRYGRVLEIGCGAGFFTRSMAALADHVVAIDIAPAAIARARDDRSAMDHVDFRVANVMETDLEAEGPWDLIVMSETIYYLGWLYSFFDVAWLAARLFDATNDGGRFVMANTLSGGDDYLLRPFVIRTYRDLFENVGYDIEAEEMFRGSKRGVSLEVLMSVFVKQRSRRACA